MNKEQAMTKRPSFLAKATEKLLKNKLAALCFVLLVLEVLLAITVVLWGYGYRLF